MYQSFIRLRFGTAVAPSDKKNGESDESVCIEEVSDESFCLIPAQTQGACT